MMSFSRTHAAFSLIVGAMLWFYLIDWPRSHRVEAQAGTVAIATPVDITGDGSAHQAVAAGGTARWVSIVTCGSANCAAANASPVRIGDSNTNSTRGQPVAPGGTFFFPALPSDPREGANQHFYNLGAIYYYAASGDKLSVSWGN